ncbi:MAG: T9SS type A sorting domain-containing protein [candidate division Zixibacteria bacterium]|nr:T9SS type A sorting domain-containing protein [candidate division Zixibacteria bacterium]
MRRVIFFIIVAAFSLFMIPDGAATESAGLEDHILRHNARVNKAMPDYVETSSKNAVEDNMISLFGDTKINEETSADRFRHQYSALTLMSEGRVLVGWEDDRNGDFDIYGQMVSSDGMTAGSDQLLINDNSFLSNTMVDFAYNSDGFIVVVWVDESGDLWLRGYDSTFTPLDAALMVNDNISSNIISYPDVEFLSDSRVVVVWEDTRLESAVYGQIYNTDLSAAGDNFKISPDDGGKVFWSPAIAAGTNGTFAVVWEELGSSGSSVFLLLYDADALPSGISINVADLANQTDNQFGPDIVGLGAEGYLVGWSDSRDSDQNMYVQHFDGNGNRIDDNVKVSEGTGNSVFDLYLTGNPGGNFLALWANTGVRSEILVQAFDATGKTSGGNITVSDGLALGERFSPNAIFRTDGSVLVTFTDTRTALIDIYAQILNSDFTLSSNNFKLTSGASGAHQNQSRIARMAGDDFGVLWTDMKNDDGDIYFQRGSGLGNPYGSNLKLNDDAGSSYQAEPSIGSATNGNVITAWVDGRSTGDLKGINIFGQLLDPNGQKAGVNFLVNDDPAEIAVVQAEPACDISPSGKAVIAWRDRRNGADDIYAQIYDPSGDPSGANFQVNQETIPCSNPRIAMLNNDMFMIAWQIEVEARSYVKFQLYNAQGTETGSNMLIPVDTSINQQLDFDIAVNPYFGIYAIAWINQNDTDTEVYAMMVAPDGVPASPVKIVSDMANLGFDDVSVGMDSDNSYVVAWSDMRSGVRRSYLSFVDAGTTVFPNQLISQNSGIAREQEQSIAINGRTWFASWSDNRNSGDGYDIYVNSNLYNPTSAEDDTDTPVPDAFNLSQNYPNPFNPITRIDFSLAQDMPRVQFEVYNILGRKVHSKTMTDLSAGAYTIEFSGEGLSSGIYLYRLRADDQVVTKKMSLMK